MEHTWSTVAPLSLPPSPVIGGHETVYVGLTKLCGQTLVASVMVNQKEAQLAWDGMVHTTCEYEILTGEGYKWKAAAADSIPPHAVSCGITKEGDTLYVGRGIHKNNTTVGTIHPAKGCLFIPYGGEEVQLKQFDVLVVSNIADKGEKKGFLEKLKPLGSRLFKSKLKTKSNTKEDTEEDSKEDTKENTEHHIEEKTVSAEGWLKATFESIPPGAVVAGHDETGDAIYMGRATHKDEILPASVIPSKQACHVNYNGFEMSTKEFEVLCGSEYVWIKPTKDEIPSNAVSVGQSLNDQPWYVARAEHKNCLKPGNLADKLDHIWLSYEGEFIPVNEFEVLVNKS